VLSTVPPMHRPDPTGRSLHWQAKHLFETTLPPTTPAYYRLRTTISDANLIGTRTGFVTVIEQYLEADIELERSKVSAGEQLRFALHNTGPGPLAVGEEYDRLEHGRWIECLHDHEWHDIGIAVDPGDTRAFEITIPDTAIPDAYRVSKGVHALGTELHSRISAEFEVT